MRDGSIEKPKERIYSIKQDFLINNYKCFLTEFYALIDEDMYKQTVKFGIFG